jgi:autoinducer 2-degrading protein
MISLLITVEVEPTRVDEFIAYITEEAADARTKEPGCRRFEISQSIDTPNHFSLAEAYDDLEALEAHRNTPHFLLFKERAANGLILNKTSILGNVIDS